MFHLPIEHYIEYILYISFVIMQQFFLSSFYAIKIVESFTLNSIFQISSQFLKFIPPL